MKNHHGGVVLVNGYLYGFNDSILTCLEFATGKRMWRDRSVGKGSVTYADGRLYHSEREQRRRARRSDADGIPRDGPLHDSRQGPPELGAPGDQRRPALRSQPGFADGVRHQGEVGDPSSFLFELKKGLLSNCHFC